MSYIIPTMRYKNAAIAIDWLCAAFGFQRHRVVEEEPGIITHAQLVYEGAMIMLGSVRQDAYGEWIVTPGDVAGKTTQAPYMVVGDPVAHYDCARKAGAEIVIPLEDQGDGCKAYSCLDLEGHLWNFGNYDPWKE